MTRLQRSSVSQRRKISIQPENFSLNSQTNTQPVDASALAVQKSSVSILMSFVPNLLIDQILTDKWDSTCSTRPPCTRHWCASAFIDISGFSSLASELQSEDSNNKKGGGQNQLSGAESLTILLNNTLRRLIDVVANYGGDIVKVRRDLRAWGLQCLGRCWNQQKGWRCLGWYSGWRLGRFVVCLVVLGATWGWGGGSGGY